MFSPSEVGHDLTLYALGWIEERMRLTRALARGVAKKPRSGAVHDVRVACRRLREAIAFFQGVPEVPSLGDVDRAAKALAKSVGRLRELDVAAKRLSDLGSSRSSRSSRDEQAKAALGEVLIKRRRRAKKKYRERIEKRARALDDAIEGHLPLYSKPRVLESDRARESHLRAFVEARVAEKRALVEALFDEVRLDSSKKGGPRADRLHAVRVAIKHWRYSSEIARAVMPRVLYRPMASRLRVLQELGGKSQDFADLERIADEELKRAGVSPRARRPILSAVRTSRKIAAAEFISALGSRLPAAQNVDTK
jgi:CHAD domain-containing protein